MFCMLRTIQPRCPWVWLIPPFILFVAASRCLYLVAEMHRIGKYLKEIENADIRESAVPGWETFKTTEKRGRFDKVTTRSAALIWLIGISLVLYITYREFHRIAAAPPPALAQKHFSTTALEI